jgi:hypothetical protein
MDEDNLINSESTEEENSVSNLSSNTSKSVGIMPKDIDVIISVSEKVYAKWIETAIVVPNHKTVDFKQYIDELKATSNHRVTEGAYITPLVHETGVLELKIKKGVKGVKTNLLIKYGEDKYKSYFPSVGFTKVSGNYYSVPLKTESCKASLQILLTGLVLNEITKGEFGLEYWQEIYDNYVSNTNLKSSKKGSVSGIINKRDILKAKVIKTLSAIIMSIKLYFPDTYESVLREWGFQKELY